MAARSVGSGRPGMASATHFRRVNRAQTGDLADRGVTLCRQALPPTLVEVDVVCASALRHSTISCTCTLGLAGTTCPPPRVDPYAEESPSWRCCHPCPEHLCAATEWRDGTILRRYTDHRDSRTTCALCVLAGLQPQDHLFRVVRARGSRTIITRLPSMSSRQMPKPSSTNSAHRPSYALEIIGSPFLTVRSNAA